jgi:ribosomal protein S28E/S33
MDIVVQDGMMLSAEHMRIAEIIQDYDPYLELIWIPPNQRDHNDTFPFAVRHNPPGKESYIVFKLRETEVDHRVLARLFRGDNSKGDILSVIESEEAARRLLEMKKQKDEMEEARELAAWAVKAKPGAKHNGVRFD